MYYCYYSSVKSDRIIPGGWIYAQADIGEKVIDFYDLAFSTYKQIKKEKKKQRNKQPTKHIYLTLSSYTYLFIDWSVFFFCELSYLSAIIKQNPEYLETNFASIWYSI